MQLFDLSQFTSMTIFLIFNAFEKTCNNFLQRQLLQLVL